jgi:hypothetical protein
MDNPAGQEKLRIFLTQSAKLVRQTRTDLSTQFREQNVCMAVALADPHNARDHATQLAGIVEIRAVLCVSPAWSSSTDSPTIARANNGTNQKERGSMDRRFSSQRKDEAAGQSGKGGRGNIET